MLKPLFCITGLVLTMATLLTDCTSNSYFAPVNWAGLKPTSQKVNSWWDGHPACPLHLAARCESNPNRASTRQTITVTLSSWQSSPTESDLLQQVLNSFEEKHPNIKIKHEIISDQYMDVIRTRLISEAAPDVFYLDGAEAPALVDKGVLEPLNSYITKDFEVTDFEASLINVLKYKDTIYGIHAMCDFHHESLTLCF